MMDISVGLGPNFVMRQGQTEINHGCKVFAEDDQGEVLFLEKPAHRSLIEVAKVVVAHLRVCGVSEAQFKGAAFIGTEAVIKRSGSMVQLTMALPELLSNDWRVFLVGQFREFVSQFYTRRKV